MGMFRILRRRSFEEARRIDLNKNGTISKYELYQYIEKNSK